MVKANRSIVRLVITPSFVVALLILLLAAIYLKTGMHAIAAHYAKKPAPIRKSLKNLRYAGIESFQMDKIIEGVVSDSNIGTSERFHAFFKERGAAVSAPKAALLVTYYSDPGDAVVHTPEVCARQERLSVECISDIRLETPELGLDYPNIEVRRLDIKGPSGDYVLFYTFCVNGVFCCDRVDVRWIRDMSGDSRTYFSKIEVNIAIVPEESKEKAEERAQKLLREALAVLIKEHFPKRDQLTS